MKTRRDTGQAGSLIRAEQILRALASGPAGGLAVREITEETGLPRPTVYRVLSLLSGLGWVERERGSDTFELGPSLAALGHRTSVRRPIARVAGRDLANLADRLDQAVYLDIRAGFDVECAARFESRSATEVHHGFAGMRAPFGATPASMAMLAALPLSAAAALIEANRARYARIEGLSHDKIVKLHEQARRSGYARFAAIMLDRRMCGLGAVVHDPEGHPAAGIGTSYPRATMTARRGKRCLDEMITAAARIERRLWGAPLAKRP